MFCRELLTSILVNWLVARLSLPFQVNQSSTLPVNQRNSSYSSGSAQSTLGESVERIEIIIIPFGYRPYGGDYFLATLVASIAKSAKTESVERIGSRFPAFDPTQFGQV